MSSVCPSVTLVDHDHIGWISWKLTAQINSPTSSLFVAQRSSIYSQGNVEKFLGRKCSFNTYVHNVRLNWVKFNRESRDLRWRCICLCLFTFVASRGNLCDRTAFFFVLDLSVSFLANKRVHIATKWESSRAPRACVCVDRKPIWLLLLWRSQLIANKSSTSRNHFLVSASASWSRHDPSLLPTDNSEPSTAYRICRPNPGILAHRRSVTRDPELPGLELRIFGYRLLTLS